MEGGRRRRGECMVLMGNSAGKSSLWRPRPRWEDSIKRDLEKKSFGCTLSEIIWQQVGINGGL